MDGLVVPAAVCPPELKVRTPAHTKQLGWYVEFEFRVTHRFIESIRIETTKPSTIHFFGSAHLRGMPYM